MDLHRPLPLRIAEAEAELVRLEGEMIEADARLDASKKKIPGVQRTSFFLLIPCLTILFIPIFVPLWLIYLFAVALPLNAAMKTTERTIADLRKAIGAKRVEVARLKVEAASA